MYLFCHTFVSLYLDEKGEAPERYDMDFIVNK